MWILVVPPTFELQPCHNSVLKSFIKNPDKTMATSDVPPRSNHIHYFFLYYFMLAMTFLDLRWLGKKRGTFWGDLDNCYPICFHHTLLSSYLWSFIFFFLTNIRDLLAKKRFFLLSVLKVFPDFGLFAKLLTVQENSSPSLTAVTDWHVDEWCPSRWFAPPW